MPPYCSREGGFVCNIAIDRHATATASVHQESDTSDVEPLVEAIVRRSGLSGIRLSVRNDFPVAAGLGGSSAASAAMHAALDGWRGREPDRVRIAESGRRIEVEELGIAGGRQDHYAATHGGALALTFTDTVDVRRLAPSRSTRDELLQWATLIYTGESRISGETITAVLDAYEAGDTRVTTALTRMKELARDMATALEAGDLHALGELVGEHWHYQRSLHPSIPTARIDEIVSRATAAGAAGAKAMGASGGGCVLVLSRPANTQPVREAIRALGTLMEFGFDDDGVKLLQVTA